MPPRGRREPPEPTVVPIRGRSGGAGGGTANGSGGSGTSGRPARSGIGEARRYSPRGRTVRDGASRDPFRPALELLHGEPAAARTPKTPPRQRTAAVPPRAARARPTKASKAAPRRPVRKPRRAPRLAEPARRLRVATVLILVMFMVVAGRLVTLQLTDAGEIARRGLHDRLANEVLFAPRGAILDRSGHVLAQSVAARYVYADPSMIAAKDVQRIAEGLRSVLGIPTSELIPKLSRKKRTDGSIDKFEYLARSVDIGTGNAVTALNLPGIGVGDDERRTEPGRDLAANLIGFTGIDGSGLTGLEAAYDDQLAGTDGMRIFETGHGDLGTQIPGGYEETKPAHPGSSLQLTIDRDLQYNIQQTLARRMTAVNADFGAAVVLDIHTGEVLAQASFPPYDAANPGNSTAAQRIDAASQLVIDPGSVHKVITLAAGLQSGAITPDAQIPLPGGSIRKGDTTFSDTTPLRAGTKITIPGILAYSSNVGAITVADKIGPQTLYDFQLKFGLGSPTHEGMPGEAAGLVQPPDRWSGSSYGSIPIGMGVSVTPLQMAAVYATIANNGVYVQPHLIRATIAPDSRVTPWPAPKTRQVLSTDCAAALRQDLEAVVTAPGATGHSAAVPGYRVAGKTGTGLQVKDGRYAPGEVASFIGMAPADAPRYVIAVFAHSPGGEGGAVAAPAFHDMMAFTLRYFQVPPTGTSPPKFTLTL
jgi:cell division protein FtsI (penicillin-binding protein 3)